MPNLSENTIYNGTKMALLLVPEKAEKEDWGVFIGSAKIEGDKLFIDFGTNHLFQVFPKWFGQIKAIPENLKNILGGADFYLPLIVGKSTKGKEGLLRDIGLRWPARPQ